VLFAYKLMMPFMLRFLSTGIEGAEYIQTKKNIANGVTGTDDVVKESVVDMAMNLFSQKL
jgi:Sec-independent protein secretion pathway component TatC